MNAARRRARRGGRGDRSPPERLVGRLGRGGTRIAAFVALLGTAAPATLAAQGSPAQGAIGLEGEYGLRVTDTGDEIGVGWLTSDAREGRLRVLAGDSVLFEASTPVSGSHFVTLPRPDRDVEIRYGARGEEPLYNTTLFLGPESPPESGELTDVDSLYVVGDVHGEYDRVRQLLKNAGLVDEDARWTGGRRHVVFLGDLFDRGADVTRTLWLLYRLEREARAAGGGAHVVLGNHETMIFTDDLRYVSPKEQLIAGQHGVPYGRMFDIRTTVLGRWLASRPGLMRIDGLLLAHGGVVPELEPHSVVALNDSLRTFLAEDLFYRWADTTMALATDSALAEAVRDQYDTVIVMDSTAVARRQALIFDERSILWYRGYVQSDTLAAELERTLDHFGADTHIVGHTPVPSISLRYGGRLAAVDLEEAASEMLLMTRDESGERRAYKLGLEGPPERLRAEPTQQEPQGREPPGRGPPRAEPLP